MECPRCGRLPGNSHTEICALQGEIERLRHDIERHIAIASELATENEALRSELAKAVRPDCRLCEHFDDWDIDCVLRGTAAACVGGHNYLGATPVRLYETDAAMAGGEK